MSDSPSLWSHGSVWLVLGGAFLTALPLGALLARARYCSLGAISDWLLLRDSHRARMWLAAAGIAILGVHLGGPLMGLDPALGLVPYASPHFAWMRYLAGGFLFGIGMVVASGCASRQLLRVGGGSLKAALCLAVAAVVVAWLVDGGGYRRLFAPVLNLGAVQLAMPGPGDQRLGTLLGLFTGRVPGHLLAGAITGTGLLWLARGRPGDRLERAEWQAGLALGAAVVIGWWLTGGPPGRGWQEDMAFMDAVPRGTGTQSYTFIAPLADLLAWLEGRATPTFGLCGAAGLVAGSALWHWRLGRWRLERHRGIGDLARSISGGALLGLGGVTALGCTVGQGVTGLSLLALGSILATLSTIAGALCAMKVAWALSGDG